MSKVVGRFWIKYDVDHAASYRACHIPTAQPIFPRRHDPSNQTTPFAFCTPRHVHVANDTITMATTLQYDYSGGQLRAEEATGLVTVRVKSGPYSVVALIQVPDGYPMEGCGVELRSHNFPEHIARRHVVQVMKPRILVLCWNATVVVVMAVMHARALL